MTNRNEKRFLTHADSVSSATELAKTLYKIPVLLTTWTRCGKANCRCTAGHLHGPYHALHWREGSIQRRRYIRALEVEAVRRIIETRRAERRAVRLAFTRSLKTWRELAALAADYEAQLGAEGDQQ